MTVGDEVYVFEQIQTQAIDDEARESQLRLPFLGLV